MADSINDFLAQDGRLQQKLELRDSQSGFVGLSGQVWTVEPSGRWNVARFINEQVQEPHFSGQLTYGQLNGLAGVLAAQDFIKLPNRFGRELNVNPRTLTIRFGTTEKLLILNAGENLETTSPELSQSPDFRRFRAIFESIIEFFQ